MKKITLIIIGVIIVILAGLWMSKRHPDNLSTFTIRNTKLNVEVVTTQADQERGLGGRTELASNYGMLFKFDVPDRWGIWMKDMNIPLDIMWFDQDFKLISLQEHVSPDTYPEIFQPATPALYVLETHDGFVAEHGIVIGDKAVFEKK